MRYGCAASLTVPLAASLTVSLASPPQDTRVKTHAFPDNIFAGLGDMINNDEINMETVSTHEFDLDICDDLERRMRRASVEDIEHTRETKTARKTATSTSMNAKKPRCACICFA